MRPWPYREWEGVPTWERGPASLEADGAGTRVGLPLELVSADFGKKKESSRLWV